MPVTPDSNDGAFNGTTPVTVVAAPSAGTKRLVKSITIHNLDTAAVTVTVRYVSGANTRQIMKVTLAVNDSLIFGEEDFFVLDSTKSITALLAGAATTTNPDFVSSWADES